MTNGHGQSFSTWSYETDDPLSLDALQELVRKWLPGTIYRCKGLVYAIEAPEQRAVLQLVGRRLSVSLLDSWGEKTPRSQIVAIGAPDSIDAEILQGQFDSCLAPSGN